MNSLADGAHASLLSLASRLFVLSALFILFIFFFVSVFPFSADKELYWFLTEIKMELPFTFPSCSSTDSDVPQMEEALHSWC